MNVMKYDTEYLILLDRLTMNIIEQVESFQNAANHFHGTATLHLRPFRRRWCRIPDAISMICAKSSADFLPPCLLLALHSSVLPVAINECLWNITFIGLLLLQL